MSVKRKIPESAGVYFITFTCCKWLPLFEIVNGYDIVYNWFDHLKSKHHHVLGFVIMPNHVHVIIAFSENQQGVNTIHFPSVSPGGDTDVVGPTIVVYLHRMSFPIRVSRRDTDVIAATIVAYLYRMSVKRKIPESAGVYFITFTCCKWLPLFEIVNGYDIVYNWFDHLKSKHHHVLGFVIMPNHVHVIIAFSENQQGVNTIVSNGKRFMAYEIVSRLTKIQQHDILEQMAAAVSPSDKRRGKLHQVFEASFDCKECWSFEFIRQKLDYIHQNPVRGKWNLAATAIDYVHSSAMFYYTGQAGIYPVLNFLDLNDMEWAGPIRK